MCISRSYFMLVLLNKNVQAPTQSLAAHTQRQLWERARLHQVVLNCKKGMCGKTLAYPHICTMNMYVIFSFKKITVYFRKAEKIVSSQSIVHLAREEAGKKMYRRKEQPEQVINVGVATMRTNNPHLEHRSCEISSHDEDFQLSVVSSTDHGFSVITSLAF